MKHEGLSIERIQQGNPILAPTQQAWECGGTLNAAALYLERSPANDLLLQSLTGQQDLADLPDGAIAVHYRAVAAQNASAAIPLSSVGLAVFTPTLNRLICRFAQPVLTPSPQSDGFDTLGVEDPRITRLGDTFFMLYCGVRRAAPRPYKTRLCLATSTDLIHWEKHGPIPGSPDQSENKDGVLFPQAIDGRYYLLHRPWGPGFAVSDYSIWLASSDSPYGPWEEHGQVLHARPNPGAADSWLGAGSVPIALGGKRFLVIYHTGNRLQDQDREYDAGAALFDFDQFTPQAPAQVVTHRIEPILTPETAYERSGPAGQRMDVLFPCGSYEYQGGIYILYGASDLYVAAALVRKADLLSALESAPLKHK